MGGMCLDVAATSNIRHGSYLLGWEDALTAELPPSVRAHPKMEARTLRPSKASGALRLKTAQKPYIMWSLGPKTLK